MPYLKQNIKKTTYKEAIRSSEAGSSKQYKTATEPAIQQTFIDGILNVFELRDLRFRVYYCVLTLTYIRRLLGNIAREQEKDEEKEKYYRCVSYIHSLLKREYTNIELTYIEKNQEV